MCCDGGMLLSESETSIVDATKYCPECNAELNSNAEICTKCGLILPSTTKFQSPSAPFTIPTPLRINGKNHILAAILTWIFMPVGYWYVKRLKRGIIVSLATLIIGSSIWITGTYIMVAIAIYDVYRLAKNESAPLDFLNRWGL